MHPPCSCSAYLLERYATKIMQCNTKCGNRKYSPTWYKERQTNMLPESCRSRYQILGSPTNEHIICSDSCLPNHVQKPDPQYQNLYKHGSASVRPHSFHKRLKVLLQPVMLQQQAPNLLFAMTTHRLPRALCKVGPL